MIPSNISREHILAALREIDSAGVPHGRESTKFTLVYDGKPYPPKYVISLANKFANGRALSSSDFNGGTETNEFLHRLGFHIDGVSFQNVVKSTGVGHALLRFLVVLKTARAITKNFRSVNLMEVVVDGG